MHEPIEKIHLNHPDEQYSLRLRKSFNKNGEPQYSAKLKTRRKKAGPDTQQLIVKADLTVDDFAYYAEHAQYYDQPATVEQESTEQLIERILTHQADNEHTTVSITGRSGSGKSTRARQIVTNLQTMQPDLTVAILSTDHYNYGKTYLKEKYPGNAQIDWEQEDVYDLQQVRQDIVSLQDNQAIERRIFNLVTGEPELDGNIQPPSVLLCEGIFANHPVFGDLIDIKHEIPSSFATTVARRVMRDCFGPPGKDPKRLFRYALTHIERAYHHRQKL